MDQQPQLEIPVEAWEILHDEYPAKSTPDVAHAFELTVAAELVRLAEEHDTVTREDLRARAAWLRG